MAKAKKFDPLKVSLQGSNLIEASAGTGKTYSIAVMVLRLVLAGVSIKEILMVTFTKAAVAELEERVRLFIRLAQKASVGKQIPDPLIAGLVQHHLQTVSPAQAQKRLHDAVLLLDETAVLTIHGFCQQTLTEFAFETNQLFGSDTLQDMPSLIEKEVNKFWRTHITTLNVVLLGQLMKKNLQKDDLVSLVKEHLSGKKYAAYEEGKEYAVCTEDQEALSAR